MFSPYLEVLSGLLRLLVGTSAETAEPRVASNDGLEGVQVAVGGGGGELKGKQREHKVKITSGIMYFLAIWQFGREGGLG